MRLDLHLPLHDWWMSLTLFWAAEMGSLRAKVPTHSSSKQPLAAKGCTLTALVQGWAAKLPAKLQRRAFISGGTVHLNLLCHQRGLRRERAPTCTLRRRL